MSVGQLPSSKRSRALDLRQPRRELGLAHPGFSEDDDRLRQAQGLRPRRRWCASRLRASGTRVCVEHGSRPSRTPPDCRRYARQMSLTRRIGEAERHTMRPDVPTPVCPQAMRSPRGIRPQLPEPCNRAATSGTEATSNLSTAVTRSISPFGRKRSNVGPDRLRHPIDDRLRIRRQGRGHLGEDLGDGLGNERRPPRPRDRRPRR